MSTGTLTISEYNNKGDLSLETPIEPALKVTKTEMGTISDALQNDTLMVALYASVDCEFAFIEDDGKGETFPEHAMFVPLAAKTETTRIVHLNAKLRIAVR
jgi:hypothetical protein